MRDVRLGTAANLAAPAFRCPSNGASVDVTAGDAGRLHPPRWPVGRRRHCFRWNARCFRQLPSATGAGGF